jgi:chromosome segregation ATPase
MREDMKGCKAETENSLKELRQEYSRFKELDAGQAAWLNKAGGEIGRVKDNVKLAEERVAKLVEEKVTESQVASQNSIQEGNAEIKRLREHLAAGQATDQVISSQVPPVMGSRSDGRDHRGRCVTER